MTTRASARLAALLILGLVLAGCAPRITESRACRTAGDRSSCLADPAGCPCEAYGDCAMDGCVTRGAEIAAERDAAARRAAVENEAAPRSGTASSVAPSEEASTATTPASEGCATADDRATCTHDPANCPCEAYGDCTMQGCVTRGAEVQAERDAAAAAPGTTPAPTTTASPTATAPRIDPATPPATQPTAAPASGRHCRTGADRQQCAEEAYYCPCDAYGDCGMDCCREPERRPREQVGCRTEDDRAICNSDPSRCPCPVGGACGMSGCS